MTKTKDAVILLDSPESAIYETRTLTGWWTPDYKKFYGEREDLARYAGATHRKCDCGAIINKCGYTICPDCRAKKLRDRHEALERREYKGEPLMEYDGDRFFRDADELADAVADGDIDDGAMLVFAEPRYGRNLDPDDYLCDDMPEEAAALSKAVYDAAAAFNKAVREMGPLSYMPGKIVPVFSPQNATPA